MHEDQERYAENDPRHHTIKIRGMLSDVRVYDPGPMWNATRFLIAGMSLAF